MKNLLFICAVLVILLSGTSGYNEERFDTMPGDEAPLFEVTENDRTVSLSDFRGRYTLITFWNSSDAASRMACSQYSTTIDATPGLNDRVAFIGINFDESRALYEEIVRIDNLDPTTQYRVDGNKAERLRASYGLDAGMGSILIDPEGRVVMFNPTAESLKTLKS